MHEEKVPTPLRVLNLALALLNSRSGRTRAELTAAVNGYGHAKADTARRSFERDLEHLRRVGLIVEVSDRSGAATYRVSASSLGPAQSFLTAREVELLLRGAESWSQPAAAAATLRNKLLGHVDRPLQVRPNATRHRLQDAENLETIGLAIQEHSVLTFDYLSRSRRRIRTVAPWRVVVHRRFLYLWGFDLDEDEPRLFRLSRFMSPPKRVDRDLIAEEGPHWTERPLEKTQFAVAPRLRVRRGTSEETTRHSHALDLSEEPEDAEWVTRQGEEDDVSVWEQRVMREADGVIVLQPRWLAELVQASLEAAAKWGSGVG